MKAEAEVAMEEEANAARAVAGVQTRARRSAAPAVDA